MTGETMDATLTSITNQTNVVTMISATSVTTIVTMVTTVTVVTLTAVATEPYALATPDRLSPLETLYGVSAPAQLPLPAEIQRI